MSAECVTCGTTLETPLRLPLRILEEAGGAVVATDYAAVFEHIRDSHPDQWAEKMAAAFELSQRDVAPLREDG
jgi:hypothetical protein